MSETSPINALPEEFDPEPGDWLLIETPTQSRKLNAAWLTDPAGGGADLAAHVMDPDGAHAASAVAATPGTTLNGTDVQAQLAQADAALSTSNTALTDHINDPTDAHLASQVGFDSTGNTFVVGDAVQAALDAADTALIAADTALANHISDPSAAHAASAVAFTPGADIAATNVQAALDESVAERKAADTTLQTNLTAGDTANTNALNAHINDALDAHDASAVSYIPSGPVVATDVQAALTEIATSTMARALPPGGTTGQVLAKTSAIDYAAAWTAPTGGGGSTIAGIPFIVDGWYAPPCAALSSTSTAAGVMTLGPVWFPDGVKIGEVGVNVGTGGVGAFVTVAIYAEGPATNPQPLTRLFMSTPLDASAVTFKSEVLATPLTLAAGRYWMGACVTGNTCNITTMTANQPYWGVYAASGQLAAVNALQGYRWTTMTAGPPATIGTTPSLGSTVMRVAFKVAA